MRKFEIKLRVEGAITLLPDSQKLFGYLMNKLSECFSKNEIENFINDIVGKCMISNLIPSGYLPTPKIYLTRLIKERKKCKEAEKNNICVNNDLDDLKKLMEELKELKKNKVKEKTEKIEEIEIIKREMVKKAEKAESFSSKAIYETLKKIEYIKKEDLPKLIQRIEMEEEFSTNLLKEYDYIIKNQKYIQKFKLESQIRKIPGFPNISYSLPIVEYKNKKNDFQKDFTFFVITEENSILANLLCNLKKDIKNLWMIGPKASSGYNCYSLEEIIESEYKEPSSETGPYINLGMLLPQENSIFWEKSQIDIYSSDRRPYELGDHTPKVISFINIGSILVCEEKKPYKIGKSIKNKYNKLHSNAIVFGNSYLENLEV
ncbi:MAG: hypothetical protein Q4A58_07985 [Fusobacterium sp.]|uniref:hypothetical protein n=1 Tax=Fusobacterium sp. TaxID=68766 RepID=UPI0026DC716E|nr:hypothetical protein [Fusobacterium sp.]MDO4691216.1 hypothetical protein [Fusobacterium sp.]